jgi:hypothetical protein
MGAALSYDNYKAAVARVDGPERALLYEEIWSVMRDAEDRLHPSPSRRMRTLR